MKILNLYSGLGGNRALWGNSHNITAVENNNEIANIYKDYFPKDLVIVDNAHSYLLNHYKEYDFIWSSPPCQSHSRARHSSKNKENFNPVYPNMNLYEEIIFLKNHFKGNWLIENVIPYYEPLIKPNYKIDRHLIWCNFPIDVIKFKDNSKVEWLKGTDCHYGFDLSNYKLKVRKQQILRNCVNPDLAKYILDYLINNQFNPVTKQLKLI
jgi:DNA (cytosine-5)-methyltransferase 1